MLAIKTAARALEFTSMNEYEFLNKSTTTAIYRTTALIDDIDIDNEDDDEDIDMMSQSLS